GDRLEGRIGERRERRLARLLGGLLAPGAQTLEERLVVVELRRRQSHPTARRARHPHLLGQQSVEEATRLAPRLPSGLARGRPREDRKSTRLNSSHVKISYAVFCLK